MSTDEEDLLRAADHGVAVGVALARDHMRDAANLLPVYAAQRQPDGLRTAMTTGIWNGYLTHVVAHISGLLGVAATDAFLTHLLRTLHGEEGERDTAPH